MEKKFKFSDNQTVAKTVYGAIIALLCITAIVIGIVAANNRKKTDTPPDENPPISDGTQDDGTGDGEGNGDNTDAPPANSTFISPVLGKVVKAHSSSVPVFSETLEAWRIHTGIDISTEEGADVYAVCDGEVSAVYSDPLMGKTVEITHANGMKSVYSNLSSSYLPTVGMTVASGEKIGSVGDSAILEIADEAHLHFEMLVNDVSVNPLDYISEEAKKVSLGITDEVES